MIFHFAKFSHRTGNPGAAGNFVASASFAEPARTWRNLQTNHSTSINSFMI